MKKYLSGSGREKGAVVCALLAALLLTGISSSEPVYATFADTGPQDGVYIGISGTYYSDAESALAELNAIRLEACQTGALDPRDPSRSLTEADYVELKWSIGLEELAKYRAGEASVAGCSTRPDGGTIDNLFVGDISPDGETFSITDSCQSMTDVAYGWSLGKDSWNAQAGDYSANSYACLINPDYDYVGMAQYDPDNGSGKFTFTAEYKNTDTDLDQTMEAAEGYVSENVEVAAQYVTALTLTLDSEIGIGESTTTTLQATVSVNGDTCGTYPVVGYTSYYSDDESIATVDSTGTVTVVGAGETSIHVTSGGVTASATVSEGAGQPAEASGGADSQEGDGSGADSQEHTHTPGEAIKENETTATCQTEGSYDEVVYCTICGAEISRSTVTTPKTDHQPELRNAAEATCELDGYTGDRICKVCGTVLETGTVISGTGHTKADPVIENKVDSTCSAEGSYDEVVYCTVCQKELSRTHRTIDKKDHTPEIINAKDATETEDGYTGDTVCQACGAIIKQGEILPAAGGYAITEGKQQTWQSGSSEGLSFATTGAVSEFKEVKVDAAVLDPENYTVKQGTSQEGTVITLNAAYLNTLSAGTYKLDLIWEKGSAETTFIVSKVAESTEHADTADTGMIFLFAGVILSALLILTALIWLWEERYD